MMFLKDWVVPLVSLGLSIWFASSAKRDADRAQSVLTAINNAVEGWQRQIMSSTANILDSLPQVVEGKATLARVEAAQALTQGIQAAIHHMAANPMPGAAGHTQEQQLRILVAQLNELLSQMACASPRSAP